MLGIFLVYFQHEVSVTLKLIQVYVTDKHGQPVTDLTKEDFELTDNGQTKNITDFEKHSLVLQAGPQAPPSVSSAPVLKMNRKFFLFFDFAFNSNTGIAKSKKAALDFIETQIRPDDEVGVISYTAEKGLTLHEYLTTDHKKIRQVVEGFGANKRLGRAVDVEGKYWDELKKVMDALNQTGGKGGIGDYTDWISITKNVERSNYNNQVNDYASLIRQLAKTLRYIPGFKNLIFFSAGIANFVLYGKRLAQYYDTAEERYGIAALRETYTEMCEELASSNSAVYAINGAGMASGHFEDSSYAGDQSLRQLARASGGQYFDNVNSYSKINQEIQNSTGNYYVLGYPIDEKWDGEYHRIKVRVKRTGCNVYGQKGYFNPKPFSEYTANEKFLHLIDLALSENPHLQAAVDFPVLVLPYAIGERTELVTLAEIPVQKIREIAGQKTEVVTLIFNEQNDVAGLERKEVSKWPLSSENIFYSSRISLSPGPYECRVVLRDMVTGKGARGSCRVKVPGATKSSLTLLPPLLLKPEGGAVFLNEEAETKQVRFSDIYPFDRKGYYPLMGPLNKTNTKLFASVRCTGSGSTKAEIVFSSSIINISSGEKITVLVSLLNQSEQRGASIFLLELMTGDLKPGEYSLYLFAEDTRSGLKAVTNSVFSVE